jgi:caffeoyl-CoA O-methyltransferase
MEIVARSIEQYIESLRAAPDPVQREMEALAAERRFPIVGPHVGQVLALLARISGARRVLELGSGYGYSALWFARALPEGGEVCCTETAEENRDLALDFLGRAGLLSKVRFHLGDAREVVGQLEGTFDIVFNDIDKEQYPAVVEPALALLRPGGLFITDNVLWKGKVAGDGPHDETTRAVLEFNRLIHEHPELTSTILPIRDGVAVCLKT